MMTTPVLIELLSDIHIDSHTFETPEESFNRVYLPAPSDPKDSILVVAGDVSHHISQVEAFLNYCATRFRAVVFVPGNHEYYRNEINSYNLPNLAPNVYAAINECRHFNVDGIDFVACTLWGYARTAEEEDALIWGMNDFRFIADFTSPRNVFTPARMSTIGLHHRHEIARLASEIPGHKIIVTHHLPSYTLVAPEYKGNPMNAGFVNDCSDYFDIIGPATWLFGHTHSHVDARIGDIHFRCNPRGYRNELGRNGYKPTFFAPGH